MAASTATKLTLVVRPVAPKTQATQVWLVTKMVCCRRAVTGHAPLTPLAVLGGA